MEHKDIPYILYEATQARNERTIKRLIIVIVIVIALLFISNMSWLYYQSQFDTYSYEQDGEGLNNINTGEQGDIYGAETENQTKEKENK